MIQVLLYISVINMFIFCC
uniref:Uncharacterized protein n=1 Tax=Anguilla anguilla TaxID=7936 RepID=A0A0E9U652_ANGAN